MKSAGNGGVLNGSLQMLHIHVLLLAAPLGAGHMAQAGADRHEGRATVRETAHYPGAAVDLPVELLNDIVGTDASPVFAPSPHFLSSLFQLHGTQLLHRGFDFLPSGFLLSWAWIALSILATSFTLERGVTENTLR